MTIFTCEAILKIIAFKKNYFKDSWNLFDLTVVILTLVVMGLKLLNIESIGKQASILRSVRILRVLRIVKKFKKLQIIFKTLVESAPSMASLGLLLLLLFFIYAILGITLFAFANTTD